MDDLATIEALCREDGEWVVTPFDWAGVGPCASARALIGDAMGDAFFGDGVPERVGVAMPGGLVETLAMCGEGRLCIAACIEIGMKPGSPLPICIERSRALGAWWVGWDRDDDGGGSFMSSSEAEGVMGPVFVGPEGEPQLPIMSFDDILAFVRNYAGTVIIYVQEAADAGVTHPRWAEVASRFERGFSLGKAPVGGVGSQS